MQRIDGRTIFSPSDLNDALDCAHLIELERRAAFGELERPAARESSGLIAAKGTAHEIAVLSRYRERFGDDFVAFAPEPLHSLALLQAAADATIAAMERGAPAIAQAAFFDGCFFGRADLLRRVDVPCARWAWSYEAVEAKLALSVKPYYLVQLAHYSAHLERIMGRAPAAMHVVLGSGAERSFRFDDVRSYERRIRERFLAAQSAPERETYPLEVSRCELCTWQARCEAQRLRDDHLSLVARIRGDQILRLEKHGITTLAQLAVAGDNSRPRGMDPKTFASLRAQASIQLRGRASERPLYEVIEAQARGGFGMLPAPDDGDLFFDIEGDPLYAPERGLEYLFGFYAPSEDRYTAFWARSHEGERAAFEAAADFIAERRARYPNLHVYHYAPYEVTAFRRLMGFYGTRELFVDDLLRNEVFVDLYAVVRQSLLISQSSYSIKKLEAFYGMERATDVRRGDDSIVMFESWLAGGDDAILDDIERYNEDDCRSTHHLLRWLHGIRAANYPELPWREREVKEAPAGRAERSELATRLLAGIIPPQSAAELRARPDEERARWLLGTLVDYHDRESKPAFWTFYDRSKNVDRLVEFDHEAIGGLELCDDVPSYTIKRSTVHTYRYPEQTHHLGTNRPLCPDSGSSAGEIIAIDDDRRLLQLKINGKLDPRALRALIPGIPPATKGQREALAAIAEAYLGGTLGERYPAIEDLLLARSPRTRVARERVQPATIDAASVAAVVNDLDGGYLAVQGPPGSGKSTLGAGVILDALRRGKRVGIAARGHKAIHNLLHKIEELAATQGVIFRGLQKYSTTNEDSQFRSRRERSMIEPVADYDPFAEEHTLAAGTPWLFADERLASRYDVLFIDEAGQLSLADALACARAARNVVLLGDPLQLSAVSQGSHPIGSDRSVLEHVLGEHETIPPDRGIFLAHSYRMAPPICRFISERVYEGRLEPGPDASLHAIDAQGFAPSGLHYAPVHHAGNTRSSPEEAEVVVELTERLLTGTVRLDMKPARAMTQDDIVVVAPYNAQRVLIRRRLEAAGYTDVRVGTVDKFQGQEAAAVIYSMATSNAESMPRDLEFLFERNRFNVAISRAQCASILVCSPDLLAVRCSNASELSLVNLLCAFVEAATPIDATPRRVPA